MISFLKQCLKDIHLAAVFSTRIPLPALGECPPHAFARSLWAFPLVGIVIGAVAGGFYWGVNMLFLPLPSALLTLVVLMLITGALHEDGLADVADGFGANGDVARRLVIMRDSRLGSFGVLALILSLGLRVSCLAALPGGWAAFLVLIAASSASRALFPAVLCWLPPARLDGLGVSANGQSLPVAMGVLLFGALVVVGCLEPLRAILALSLIAVLVILLGLQALRKIGGQTGDVLGCIQQTVEMAILLTASIP